jgi:hypothetical protein
MEKFWIKVSIGGVAIGAVVLAPEGAGFILVRYVWVGGRWVLAAAR